MAYLLAGYIPFLGLHAGFLNGIVWGLDLVATLLVLENRRGIRARFPLRGEGREFWIVWALVCLALLMATSLP